ncbi:NADPH-dependent F420 reductase [bacterium]|nr:NADPH-dependent F420 reductase [bacterium]
MRVAVLGMGNVGSTLGRRWADAGHEITFGVREPAKKKAEKAAVTTIPGAVAGAEAVLLAVPWAAAPEVLKAAGDLAGKVLLDCTNPVTPELTHLTIGFATSAGEEVARMAPGARVVKVFNTNGVGNMADPDYGPLRATMLYAGDHDDANRVAARLAEEIGMEPVWLGPLKEARLLEPLAMTWILLARHRGLGRDFALNTVRRP